MGITPIESQSHQRRGPRRPLYRSRLWCAGAAIAALLATALSSGAQGTPALVTANPDAAAPPSASIASSGSIRGVVTSNDGAVYEGARVELSGSDGAPVLSENTDSNGAFSFPRVSPGAFKLVVSSNGFISQIISGTVRAGESFDAQTIVLPVAMAASEVQVSGGSQADIAQAQLNFEEKQRVLGFFPNFYVSYDHSAVPLTTRQKYHLAWRTEIDPVTMAMTGWVAGIEQADNTFADYGQGAQGYGKRFGANYADGFFGTMIGGAVLPSILKQDPRYFYKGTGSIASRALYAIANSVICKGDNGHWQPSYSAIAGGLAAGAISNLYYPSSSRSGADVMFENSLVGTAEGALQNLIQEFVIRRLTPKLPVYPSTATQQF